MSLSCIGPPSFGDVSSASLLLSLVPMDEPPKFICRNAFVDDWDACERRINKIEKLLFSLSTFDVRVLRTGMCKPPSSVMQAHESSLKKTTSYFLQKTSGS